VPLDDDQREAARAELGRRRVMVWQIGLCSVIAVVIAATSLASWVALLLAALGAVATTMAVVRYRQLVAAVEQADR
jgi:hypothetical protein